MRPSLGVAVALAILGGCSLLVEIEPGLSSLRGNDASDASASPADAGDASPEARGDAGSEGDAGEADSGSDACPPPIAVDTFSRSVASGFGNAETGGPWTAFGPNITSVASSVGIIRMPAGGGAEVVLEQVSVRDVEVTVTVAFDKPSLLGDGGTGGELYAYVNGRRSDQSSYSVLLLLKDQNETQFHILREVDNNSTILASKDVGFTSSPGTKVRIRARFEGASPTTIRGRAWRESTTEPTGWTVQATDSASELQGLGDLSLQGYVSSRAVNSPVTLTLDDFIARATGPCNP